MDSRDHREIDSPRQRSVDSSDIRRVEPQQYAEHYVSGDGRARLVADPIGEWIDINGDALMEVRP
jgi:hypothetical protein